MNIVCLSKIPRSSSKLYYWDIYALSRSYIYNYDIYKLVSYYTGGRWVYTDYGIPGVNATWSFIETIDVPLEEYLNYYWEEEINTSDNNQDETADRSQFPDGYEGREIIVNPVIYSKDIFTGESGQTCDDLWGGSKDYYLDGERDGGVLWRLTKTEETIESSNILVGIVASEDPNAYPNNGIQGSYWYVKKE